jgi:hypothetical protein
MVHGLGGQMRNFDYLPLQKLAQRWRMVLVDRPGSGYSPRRDDARPASPRRARLVAAIHPRAALRAAAAAGGAFARRRDRAVVALQAPDCDRRAGADRAAHALLARRAGAVPRAGDPHPWLRKFFAHTLAVPLGILTAAGRWRWCSGRTPRRATSPCAAAACWLRPASFYGASTDMVRRRAGPAGAAAALRRTAPAGAHAVRRRRPVLDWRAQARRCAPPMNILFVADPLEVFKIYKDTTFSMMREAQRRGHRIAACEPRHLTWRSGDVVQAKCARSR